tara:strand:+ start:26806 stop:27351 length:546 start_codon:yes stop_codon:yes gene_type:complete
MIKQLTKLASHLDAKGLRKEADYLDAIIRKMSQQGRTVASEMSRVADLITANGAADTDPAHPCAGERVTLNFYRARLGYYENPNNPVNPFDNTNETVIIVGFSMCGNLWLQEKNGQTSDSENESYELKEAFARAKVDEHIDSSLFDTEYIKLVDCSDVEDTLPPRKTPDLCRYVIVRLKKK